MKIRALSPQRARARQYGMTLVEVLVTLVSASVGLLGVAALQLVSLKANQRALHETAATALATSMLEHIRVHRPAALAGAYDHVPFNTESIYAGSTGGELAAWQRRINEGLPGGADIAAGSITRILGTDVFEVRIRWAEEPERDDGIRIRELSVRTEP